MKVSLTIKSDTIAGDIILELDEVKAPITVTNFINYVKQGFYDGTIFHRVINGFMVQGGGFDVNMVQKKTTQAEITNEATNGLKNNAYTIAMARTMAPHSASAQFFINVKNNDFLNFKSEDLYGWGYAVFGKVVEGTELIDKIKLVETTSKNGHDDVPVTPVVITKASIIDA